MTGMLHRPACDHNHIPACQISNAPQSEQALTPTDKAVGRRIYIANIVLAKQQGNKQQDNKVSAGR